MLFGKLVCRFPLHWFESTTLTFMVHSSLYTTNLVLLSRRNVPPSTRHYLWPNKINFLFLVSCTCRSQCITCIFSMQPQCLHSLYPMVSPSSGFSKDTNGTRLYTIYTFLSYLAMGTPWIREVSQKFN